MTLEARGQRRAPTLVPDHGATPNLCEQVCMPSIALFRWTDREDLISPRAAVDRVHGLGHTVD